MCGRFVSTSSAAEIATYFGASFEAEPLPLNYNVAPTDEVYAVVADAGIDTGTGTGTDTARSVRTFRWGLVPVWAKDVKIAASLINARSETIGEKPAFKTVFANYRCLIPMAGFYEWKALAADGPVGPKGKPVKQPMFVHPTNGEMLAVAGVWSIWRDRSGPRDAPWLHTCAVITTAANATMRVIHDRMPVILDPSLWDDWLDPAEHDTALLASMLQPAPDSALALRPVSTLVNNVRNEGRELIEPVDPAATVEDSQPATLF